VVDSVVDAAASGSSSELTAGPPGNGEHDLVGRALLPP
jgi:hypothetical protein